MVHCYGESVTLLLHLVCYNEENLKPFCNAMELEERERPLRGKAGKGLQMNRIITIMIKTGRTEMMKKKFILPGLVLCMTLVGCQMPAAPESTPETAPESTTAAPADTQPTDALPSDSSPADASSADTQSSGTPSADTSSTDTQPSATPSTDTQPAEDASGENQEGPEISAEEQTATLYIGTRAAGFTEYPLSYEGILTPDLLIQGIADLTGWNLTLEEPVITGKGGMSVCLSGESALFTGPPDPQNEDFHMYDVGQLAETILDSIQKTLQMGFTGEGGDPDALDIYYYMKGELPLEVPALGLSWPLDEPYSWESSVAQ